MLLVCLPTQCIDILGDVWLVWFLLCCFPSARVLSSPEWSHTIYLLNKTSELTIKLAFSLFPHRVPTFGIFLYFWLWFLFFFCAFVFPFLLFFWLLEFYLCLLHYWSFSTFVRSAERVFWSMPLYGNLSNVVLTIRLKLLSFGKEDHRGISHSKGLS